MVVAGATWDVVSAHAYPSSGCVSMPCSASRDSLHLHLRVLRLDVCPTTVWSATGRAVGAGGVVLAPTCATWSTWISIDPRASRVPGWVLVCVSHMLDVCIYRASIGRVV